MEFKPKFVTVDDFNNYWGTDLRSILRGGSNPSNSAEAFLMRVENRLMAWIDNNTFRRIKYEQIHGKQHDSFKEAILLQAMYLYKNGDLGMESGYDQEKGVVTERSKLTTLTVAQDAIDALANAGLFNLTIKNLPRHTFNGDTGGFF